MTLLLDNNLSSRLVPAIAKLFPGATHVVDLGLSDADDEAIWRLARARGMCIVSKDDDFRQRAILRGHPPKVIILRVGNCSTDRVADLLRERSAAIRGFTEDAVTAVLHLP